MRDYKKYDYIHSQVLNMDIAVAKSGTHVYTQDGVRYSEGELQILRQNGEVTPKVHAVKRIFGGEIVTIPRLKGAPNE